jgi:putative protein-disulfide isomerase
MHAPPTLWYFADPMCSWCWGFSPVIGAIREKCHGRAKVALMLGGLRPGTADPVSGQSREEILGHWRDVRRLTGQPFTFDGAMLPGFVYDTEPACRAVIAMGTLNPESTFAYFAAVQAAFYVEQLDVTKDQTLASLAERFDVAPGPFLVRFADQAIRDKTQAHFHQTRQAGIRGFPTVVLHDAAGYTLLTSGYRPLAELEPEIENWLDACEART